MKYPASTIKRAVLCLLVFVFSMSLSAQEFILNSAPQDNFHFGYRFLRPNVDGEDQYSVITGAHELFGDFKLSGRIYLQAIIPIAYFSAEEMDREISMGNLYAGVQIGIGEQSRSRVSAGLYLPTCGDEDWATEFAMISNLYNMERYSPKTLSIYANYAYALRPEKGPLFTLEAGPSLLIPTEEGIYGSRETELLLHYGLMGGYSFGFVGLWAELNGVMIATEEGMSLGDRTLHQLLIGGQFTGGKVRPGLFYGFNLDSEWNDSIKGTFGVKIDVVL